MPNENKWWETMDIVDGTNLTDPLRITIAPPREDELEQAKLDYRETAGLYPHPPAMKKVLELFIQRRNDH